MAKRTKNWRHRVIKWSQGRVGKDFEWGETDCGSLVRKMCGIVYLSDVFPDVPEYSSLREAKEVWDETGGTAYQLKQIGCIEVDFNFLQTGDILITQEDEFDFYAAMIYVRRGFLASSIPHGIVNLKRQDIPEDSYGLRLPYEVR